MEQELKIYFPGKLIFAKGCIAGLAEEVVQLNLKKVLLLTIQPLLDELQCSLIDQLKQNGAEVYIDTSIVREPSFEDFTSLLNKVSSFNPDVVIGIGGGSVLDVAKLIAAQLDNEQQLEEIVGIGLLKGRNIKLVCVPTTSGTGSEVSPNAILVDPE